MVLSDYQYGEASLICHLPSMPVVHRKIVFTKHPGLAMGEVTVARQTRATQCQSLVEMLISPVQPLR